MDLMTGDLSNQQAVQRVHTEGPSISWLVGHLLNGRCEMLKLLDSSAENPFAAQFDRARPGDSPMWSRSPEALRQDRG
jgi:hypothetical protein